MRRYQQIYDSAVSKRYKLREKYAKDQFSSAEYAKFTKFKRVKKDILYFYLIGIVVIAAVLLIICVRHNELFNKIWITYFAILALNTILMLTALGIITQVLQNASIDKRNEELKTKNEANKANDDLAKLSIVLLALENHNSYLNQAKIDGNLEAKTEELVKNYTQIVSNSANNLPTSDDFINFYQETLLNKEKES